MPTYPCPRCGTPNYGKRGENFRCNRCYQVFEGGADGEPSAKKEPTGPRTVNLGCLSLCGIFMAVLVGVAFAPFLNAFLRGIAGR